MAEKNVPRRVRVERGLYRRPSDGKFEGGYTAASGRWVIKTLEARTLTDARKELEALRVRRDRGELVEPLRLTLQQVCDEFLARLVGQVAAGDKAERTLESYQYHLRQRVLPSLGPRRIQKITTNQVAALITEWQEVGLSPSTIRSTLARLGRVFAYARRRGYVNENPLDRLEADEKPRPRPKEQRILDREELAALLAAADPAYRPPIATAAFTGLRQSEILALRWTDLDFATGFIHVRHQLSRATRQRPARLVALKTAGARRDVILLPQLAALLRQHKETAFAAGHARPTDFIFATERGTPLYYRNLSSRGLDAAAERAKLNAGPRPKLSFHDLRHTFVSHLILDLGFDAVRVAMQVGHTKPSFTLDTYAHLFERSRHAEDLRTRMAESEFGQLLNPHISHVI